MHFWAYFVLRHAIGDTYEVTSKKEPDAVWIHSCPEFDAYLSGNDKWKLKGEFADAMRRLLFVTALAQIKTTRDNEAATWVELARRRIGHAIAFRTNPMLGSLSTRKRPRGDDEKQKIADLCEELLTRLFVTKKSLPEHLVKLALRSGNKRLLARLVNAHVKGVNPLLDDVDLLILTCWDQLGPIFSAPLLLCIRAEKTPRAYKVAGSCRGDLHRFRGGERKFLFARSETNRRASKSAPVSDLQGPAKKFRSASAQTATDYRGNLGQRKGRSAPSIGTRRVGMGNLPFSAHASR